MNTDLVLFFFLLLVSVFLFFAIGMTIKKSSDNISFYRLLCQKIMHYLSVYVCGEQRVNYRFCFKIYMYRIFNSLITKFVIQITKTYCLLFIRFEAIYHGQPPFSTSSWGTFPLLSLYPSFKVYNNVEASNGGLKKPSFSGVQA